MTGVLRTAIQEALRSASAYMVGAVVHSKSKILSSGHNQSSKTHPKAMNDGHGVCVHAEHAALMGIQHYSQSNLEVTVVRIRRKDGEIAMSKPCASCMRLMESAGVKKIHYTDDDGNLVTISRSGKRISEIAIQFAKNEWKDI